MKLRLDYFKEARAQQDRLIGFQEYAKRMDALAKNKEEHSVIRIGKDRGLVTKYGIFRVVFSNSKVLFPIINFESGLTCSSAGHCPFSFQSKRKDKDSHTPLCYAQKLEGAFRNTLNAKTYQAQVVEKIARYANWGHQMVLAEEIAKMTKQFGSRYIRLSEVGDIGPNVSGFAQKVISALVSMKMAPYLYTKRPDIEREALKEAGAQVVISEEDFVCVSSVEEAKQKKLVVCPGQCGGPKGCYRCPMGKKSAVIAH